MGGNHAGLGHRRKQGADQSVPDHAAAYAARVRPVRAGPSDRSRPFVAASRLSENLSVAFGVVTLAGTRVLSNAGCSIRTIRGDEVPLRLARCARVASGELRGQRRKRSPTKQAQRACRSSGARHEGRQFGVARSLPLVCAEARAQAFAASAHPIWACRGHGPERAPGQHPGAERLRVGHRARGAVVRDRGRHHHQTQKNPVMDLTGGTADRGQTSRR
jgi:hypothetical protein